jgi:hypothetical protein
VITRSTINRVVPVEAEVSEGPQDRGPGIGQQRQRRVVDRQADRQAALPAIRTGPAGVVRQ